MTPKKEAKLMQEIKFNCERYPKLDKQLEDYASLKKLDTNNKRDRKKYYKKYQDLCKQFNISTKKEYRHPLKPDCKTCKHKDICNGMYKDCNRLTGFESPCYSCKMLESCVQVRITQAYGRYVTHCYYWVSNDKMTENI